MASPSELSVEDLRALAEKVDAGQAVQVDDGADEKETPDSSDGEVAEEKAPSQDEIEKSLEGEKKEEEDSAESSETTEKVAEPTKEEKEAERFDRNWKKLQAEKAEVERQKKELAAELAKQAKTRDLKDEQDEDGYSVKDYEYAAKKFESEGNDELAREATSKAKELYFQGFQKVWKSNMDEMIDQFPDLSDSRKPFTIACDRVLQSLPFLRTIPDGCKYAVRIALGDTSSSMVSELKAENKKLKQEVEKLNRATRLSGSLPSRLPQGKTFDDLSDKERLNHLRELAEAADRGEI
jgi:hypothetical protein